MVSNPISLTRKRVVVIGGGSGIGFAVAELAQRLGAEVTIGSSRAASVETASGRLPGAAGQVVDLRDEGRVASFFDALGPFDHLVVTAGDWGGAMFTATADLDLARAREAMEVRFWGSLIAAKHGRRSISRDGSMTFTSGLLAHRPMKGAPMATALGGAVEHLTRGLAVDLAPVRVNAVCPGLILTEHVRKTMPREMVDAYVSRLPIARGGTPEETAQAYLSLMLNGYITGQVLPVTGGGTLV